MEADWAVEIGGDAARIDGDWAGFVDLRGGGAAVESIAEAREYPSLRAALRELNGAGSPVFTSKCDVWAIEEAIDPLEFGCEAAEARVGRASYIDVIARELFGSFAAHEAWVRRAATLLRAETGACGRVDLLVRAAVSGGAEGFGVTLYAAGCGVDSSEAEAAWGAILERAATITMRAAAGRA